MANEVEILVKATDEASAVLKTFGDNAERALQGSITAAANMVSGMEALGRTAAASTTKEAV